MVSNYWQCLQSVLVCQALFLWTHQRPNKWQRLEKGCLVRRFDTKVLFELKNRFERSILVQAGSNSGNAVDNK